MKKIIQAVCATVAMSISCFAQTTLPTSWNFATTTLPTGWSEVNVNTVTPPYYSGSGSPAPAYKLDATGDMLSVFFNSAPSTVSYSLTGNSFSGGTFLVQESSNGTVWTTVHSFTSPPAGTYTGFTDNLLSTSRYVRFNYSTKVSGNIGLDNVNIAAAGATPVQEINVKQGTTTIVNGGSYIASSPVSTTLPINFSIENLGTSNTLNISAVNITGANASEFVVGTSPSTVAAISSGNLVINFTPASAGTKTVIVSIVNDDSDENPYVINLTGIGGSYATEPTAQPSNLVFSNIKSYRIIANYLAAIGNPDGYLILKKEGSAITDVPVDGTAYKRGDMIGSSIVVNANSATSFSPKNVVSNKTYYFAVFAYNGPGVYRNYLTSVAPLTGSVTSSYKTMITPTYYNGVSYTASTFVTDLHNKINPHIAQFYSNYGPLMVTPFIARDTTNDRRVITCVYSGENKIYNDPWDWTTNNFSREHTYCDSWMPNFPNNDPLPEYNDFHHLFPTNQNDANAIRSNFPLDEVVGTPIYTYLGCKKGLAAITTHTVFEPRDSHKGDAARALMYQTICYTGVGGNLFALPGNIKVGASFLGYGQDQNILKKWHFQDPPDAYEMTRNDYIDSLQHNRNPFIDSVHYACYIDFSNMTYIANPTYTTGVNAPCYVAVGIKENVATHFEYVLAPNPTNSEFYLMIDAKVAEKFNLDIIDVTGRNVYSRDVDVVNGFNNVIVNDLKLHAGIYFVNLHYKNEKITRKLVIQ
ncbi:MAG: endonuclease [Bacteroidota bacterium]